MVDTLEQAARRLGLQVRAGKKTAVGVKDGYLVQLSLGQNRKHECVAAIIRHGDTRPPDLFRDMIRASPELAAAGIKGKKVELSNGLVIYKHDRPHFRSLGAEAVAKDVEALLRALRRACPAMPETCRLCGGASAGEPILLNDVVDRVCPSCMERIQHETKRVREEYENLPFNLPLAILAAALLAVLCAVAWAAIVIMTNTMFWLVALGSGLLIGWGTLKAAGKGGPATQAVVVLATVLSVLLGQVLVIAYEAHNYAKARAMHVDWVGFAQAVPLLLWDMGGNTLFALGGGILGAYYAARRAAKSSLGATIERT